MKKFVFVFLLFFLLLFSGCVETAIGAMNAFGMFNTPKQCTQTGGQLFIKDFDFNSDTIQLNIQNGSQNEVTVTSFEGNPSPVTWASGPVILKRTESGYFALEGTFAGNVNEEINIYYTSNGLNRVEKTTCSGPV